MRIAEFLRASFVGALLFSPVMADDLEKVHEEALRVLREKLGQPNPDLPVPSVPSDAIKAPALDTDPEAARAWAEREARYKSEAEQRIAERERLQAQRRQEFEQFVKEREHLRAQQHTYDEIAARQIGQVQIADDTGAHAAALEPLHQAEAQQFNGTAQQPALQPASQLTASATHVSAPPATHVFAAASPETAPSGNPPPSNDDVHAKALEVLHQQTQPQPAPAKSPAVTTQTDSSPAPQPSPELQRRLKQMQLELEQEQLEKTQKTPDAPTTQSQAPLSDSYIKDLEQRAMESVQKTPATLPSSGMQPGAAITGPAPNQGLEERTREIIRRQNQEIATHLGSTSTPATQPQTLTPEQEAAAREALRQQEQQSVRMQAPVAPATSRPPVAPPPAVAPTRPSTIVSSAPVVTQRVETETIDVQYSKELEDRARQILAERAQNQRSATPQIETPPAAPAVIPAPVQAAAPPTEPAPAPTELPPVSAPAAQVSTPAPSVSATTPSADANSEVHTRALDTLGQMQAGTAPKTKQQRLKELTDLYRADKMGPAEYHQKRAQILAEPQ